MKSAKNALIERARQLSLAEKQIDLFVLTKHFAHKEDINSFNQTWAFLNGIDLKKRQG